MSESSRGPKPIKVDLKKLKRMLKVGVPKTRIAQVLKIGRTTLYKIIEENSSCL